MLCRDGNGNYIDLNSSTIKPIGNDNINHPKHYTSHPSGVEHIDIVKHYDFCVGNAIKYLWRAGIKEDAGRSAKEKEIEDLEKAIWYIKKKIEMLKDGV